LLILFLEGDPLKRFKIDIKENVLMAVGTTVERYYEKRQLNSFGYDPVDEVVISVARSLSRRYLKVFGLLYECHSILNVVERLPERGFATLPEETVRKYMRDAKARIIKLMTEDDAIISRIKEVIEVVK